MKNKIIFFMKLFNSNKFIFKKRKFKNFHNLNHFFKFIIKYLKKNNL